MERFANYHTHTFRCGHATGTEEEYVLAAIEGGWKVLGFSEHMPWPYESGFTNEKTRMPLSDVEEHLRILREMREKYRESIRLYIGFECEYFPAYLPWLRDFCEKEKPDYLLLGNHFDRTDEGGFYYGVSTEAAHIRSYTENTLQGMETGLFRYLAHPDLPLMQYPAFDEEAKRMSYELCRAAKTLDMPLEYNLQGLRHIASGSARGVGYPCPDFWRIAASVGNTAIVGVDAHAPEVLCDGESVTAATDFLHSLGIRTIDRLPDLS